MAAMREGTTRGMMTHFNMLRNNSPMYFTYIASLLVHGSSSSLEYFSPNPRQIPENYYLKESTMSCCLCVASLSVKEYFVSKHCNRSK